MTSIGSDFRNFSKTIKLDDSKMRTTTAEIAKKLNKYFYDMTNEENEHMYIVGSVGRQTAIKGSSDLDLLFTLPEDVYSKFNAYENNGQSQLLQEVKRVLKERYPKTDISGDGQVVVIEFDSYTVELLPAFIKSDAFLYPDTHNGGSWKKTKPILEQEACDSYDELTDGTFRDFTRIIRAWKNNEGFSFSGLLIDTLVANFFQKNDCYSNVGYNDYLNILYAIYDFLKDEDPNQSYWLALGSNQQIKDKGGGSFVNKAKNAYKKLSDAEPEDYKDVIRELLGKEFSTSSESERYARFYRHRNTEEYIEDKFKVDILYNLKIDCVVTQDGWRTDLLSNIIRKNKFLRIDKTLDFKITSTNCPEPYAVYWKVRNVGEEAERRDDIRGQIVKDKSVHREYSKFKGAHFVECYLVKGKICVAKARIDVPISSF